jgi:hypothetical protein
MFRLEPSHHQVDTEIIELVICNVSRVAQSVVSGYGLDNGAIEVRSSAQAKGFFL